MVFSTQWGSDGSVGAAHTCEFDRLGGSGGNWGFSFSLSFLIDVTMFCRSIGEMCFKLVREMAESCRRRCGRDEVCDEYGVTRASDAVDEAEEESSGRS